MFKPKTFSSIMTGVLLRGSKIAVVGAGGKTSLVGLIAGQYAGKKVLVSPSAKILPMTGQNVALVTGEAACRRHEPRIGVNCLGTLGGEGKLCALPPALLRELAPLYEIALIEADGSRGLLLKGYRGHEPAVPPFADCVLALVNIKALGTAAVEGQVHRLPEFLEQNSLKEGERAGLNTLASMTGVMLRGWSGAAYIVINGCNGGADFRKAAALAEILFSRWANIIAGCTVKNEWRVYEA